MVAVFPPGHSARCARVVINEWKYNYNRRRHSGVGYQPPARYAAACTHH
jgi:putative transposase